MADCFDKIKVWVMKKILMSLIILNCSFANAYEYSSDHNDRYDYERDEWHESNSRYAPPPRYLQNPQQPPIQIFLSPNMPNYERHHDKTHRHRHENNQYREERYWRERREELEQKPQRRGAENPFYQDDTHW
jgi:hypothetical protein